MTRISFILLSFALSFNLLAQIKTVNYNILGNQLNEGLALPAEEKFAITGIIPSEIDWVEAHIHKGRIRNEPVQVLIWKRPFAQPVPQFELTLSEPLRNNDPYVFQFFFYQKANAIQLKMLQQSLHNNLGAYVDANFEIGRRGLVALSSKKVFSNNLNEIVHEGMVNFKHFSGKDFAGFSDIVNLKIDQIQNTRLKNARFNVFAKKENRKIEKATYAQQLLNELKELLRSEVDQYLSDNMLVLREQRTVNARTEKISSYLPINIGYGGVYFGGSTDNFEYDGAPYLGVSFPLGNRAFTKFLGNASLSTGIMLRNLENNEQVFSGPLVDRPIYLALGYQVFKVMRFNAGAALTSTEANGSGGQSLQVYPFVGISMELNLWVGFSRNR